MQNSFKNLVKSHACSLSIDRLCHMSIKYDADSWIVCTLIWNQKIHQNIQRVPALRAFWDLETTVLHEICVSGTVVSPPTTLDSGINVGVRLLIFGLFSSGYTTSNNILSSLVHWANTNKLYSGTNIYA